MSTYKLDPALRAELNRKSNWRGALEVAKDWALVFAGFGISLAWPHPLAWVLSVLLLAAAMAGFAILQHEASHRSLFASAKVNDFVGEYLAALPILQSMPGYRAYHMTHHRLAGTPEDPDLVMTEGYPVSKASLRRKLLRDLSGSTGIKSVIGLLGMYAGYWQYELTGKVRRVEPAPQGIGGYLATLLTRLRPVKWLALRVPALYWDDEWSLPKQALDRQRLSQYRLTALGPGDNRALGACAEFSGDVLLVESEQDDYVPHNTLMSYRSAFVSAHSLTHRIVDGADHALSSDRSQKAYSAMLTAWISEMVIGARLDRYPHHSPWYS